MLQKKEETPIAKMSYQEIIEELKAKREELKQLKKSAERDQLTTCESCDNTQYCFMYQHGCRFVQDCKSFKLK